MPQSPSGGRKMGDAESLPERQEKHRRAYVREAWCVYPGMADANHREKSVLQDIHRHLGTADHQYGDGIEVDGLAKESPVVSPPLQSMGCATGAEVMVYDSEVSAAGRVQRDGECFCGLAVEGFQVCLAELVGIGGTEASTGSLTLSTCFAPTVIVISTAAATRIRTFRRGQRFLPWYISHSSSGLRSAADSREGNTPGKETSVPDGNSPAGTLRFWAELLPKSRTDSINPWRQHAVVILACGCRRRPSHSPQINMPPGPVQTPPSFDFPRHFTMWVGLPNAEKSKIRTAVKGMHTHMVMAANHENGATDGSKTASLLIKAEWQHL